LILEMSTCKELTARLSTEKDSSEKAKLEDRLAVREKSHRDALKTREKVLRGKESAPLCELLELLNECEAELPDDDSILKRVRASVFSRESHLQENYEAKLSKKNLSCRMLEEYLTACESELGASSSPQSVELLGKMRGLLQARRQSHRAPLEREVSNTKGMSIKDLTKLRQRLVIEVGESDILTKDLAAAEKARDTAFRFKLVGRFKDMIRDIKKIKTQVVQEFLDECMEELDDNDPLLSQVKSTLENKMLESKGMKQLHNMDELERGEREKLTDDLSTSRGKKSKTDTPVKKKSKSSKSASGSSVTSMVSAAVEVISGFRSDLSGAPPSSTFYKLGIIIVFLMYITIVFYSTSLAFKVTKVEVDVSRLTGGFSFPRSIADASGAATLPAKTSSGASSPQAAASQAAAPQASAAVEPAEDSTSNDNSGGGGGDDDD
jgi:hypothetical protein